MSPIAPLQLAAAMCGMDAAKTLRISALLSGVAVGLLSLRSEIAGYCGKHFAIFPNKIASSGQPQMDQNLSSWQLTPPWIPPKIEAKKVASGIRASVWCKEDCRAKFPCKQEEVKICFWDQIFGVVSFQHFFSSFVLSRCRRII